MRRAARLGLALAAAALLAAGAAASARADGDPASDVLYFQDVFLPFPKPAAEPERRLETAVAASNKAGHRIKVAVVASPQDLGSVPSLFGKPQVYAQFLGTELRSFYTGRLLVAMPNAFGVYENGKQVTASLRAINDVSIGEGPDGLTDAAAVAVAKLRTVGSPTAVADKRPPTVRAIATSAVHGKTATLAFRARDNSGRTRQVVRVYGANFLLYASISTTFTRAAGAVASVKWHVPKALKPMKLRFCVLSFDRAGNESAPSCASLRIR